MNRIEICNLGLSHVGGGSISGFEDNTPEADLCRAQYEAQRDLLLSDHDWKFASKRRVLESKTLPTEVTEWRYAYVVPSDCIAFRAIVNPLGRNEPPVQFDLEEGEGEVLLILCDEEAATGRFTRRFTTDARFPIWFAHALAWRIALAYALDVVKREEQIRYARDGISTHVPMAMARDANQIVRRIDPEPQQHRAR